MAINVVWFKRDLRLSDHAALELASRLPQKCLLLYIFEPALLGNSHYRGRHWQFIAQSLRDLQQVLNASGRELAVLEGNSARGEPGKPSSVRNSHWKQTPALHHWVHSP